MTNRSVVIAGWITVAAGFALMAIHYFAGADGDPEGWFAAVGFGAPFIGAGSLALVGERMAKPMLCAAAGVALAIMSVASFVMFPLLIAAGFMLSAIRSGASDGGYAMPMVFAAVLIVVFGVLVFHQDPVTWSSPGGDSGSSSNIVTTTEASLSLVSVAAVVAGSIVWSNRSTREL